MKCLMPVHKNDLCVLCSMLCIAFAVLYTIPCTAQANVQSRLFDALRTAKNDTTRVNIYYSLSRSYWNKNADSALFMAQKSLQLAQKIHFEKGIALAYLAKGVALGYKGSFPEALKCHLQCLSISEKLGMNGLAGNEYGNIGILYTGLEDYSKALYYFQKAYKIALAQHDPTGFATFGTLVNIGEVFKKKGEPDSAIAYNARALATAKKVKDSVSIAIATYNIGDIYITKKDYARAATYLFDALAIARKIGDDEDVAYSHNSIALIYYNTGDYPASLRYAKMGLQEGEKSGMVDLIKTAYHVLYLASKKTGSYKNALYYRNLEIAINDSLNTVAKEKAIKNMQSTYELDKKQQQINLLRKDEIINKEALGQAKFRRDISIAGTAVLLVIAFILLRNYTQKRKLSEQLAIQNKDISAQNQQLEELLLVKDRLFSIIGHDLRGPIHTVSNMMDIVKEKGLSEEENTYWIEKASETLRITSHLVENLLYWAKSQMDGIQANPVQFDVQKIIEQNIVLLKARAAEKKVMLTTTGLDHSETVYGDEAMIDIVIRNLAENAVKFSKAGDTVTIAAEKQESSTIITVKDNGKGIPEEAQSKIFNKFTSYTTFGTANEKGSGLGLLLCKELVEKNQGRLWFESKAGIGSSFHFTIPSLK